MTSGWQIIISGRYFGIRRPVLSQLTPQRLQIIFSHDYTQQDKEHARPNVSFRRWLRLCIGHTYLLMICFISPVRVSVFWAWYGCWTVKLFVILSFQGMFRRHYKYNFNAFVDKIQRYEVAPITIAINLRKRLYSFINARVIGCWSFFLYHF